MSTQARYTFGTGGTAAERLSLIAGFFNPPAESFIRRYVKEPVGTALDLGCGPGCTTEMLWGAVDAERVCGMDCSEKFLSIARDRYKHLEFVNHDVRLTPFPVTADIIYVRFLLSHLKDPVACIGSWTAECRQGGLLLIDEVEDVYTDEECFRRYLSVNRGLVASQGASLYVGSEIGTGTYDADVLCNEAVFLPVPANTAASWFYPNTLTVWEEEEFVKGILTRRERDGIRKRIRSIMMERNGTKGCTWKMRRIVLRNTG
ncbi:MAG: class I SAM-dependent methyltransferase [Spirochaetales bacterium]|nr:class I SAM-dependent methyltransferase [Spirochaetales bacterium]